MTRRDLALPALVFIAGAFLTQALSVRLLCATEVTTSECGPVSMYAIDELVLLGPALAVGLTLAWKHVNPTAVRRLVWLSVALTLAGGLTLVARPWHLWPSFSGASLVAIPVIVGIQAIGRWLRSRP